ncbi:MAG: TetR/AcrR family transcriptional regulator [Candidatus Binatia bacterium]|nr:TetR/AcrR family transcriptional regulator [Candidatus Binatia bacterium]
MTAKRATKATDLDDESVPAWQQQSVDRSLRAARARAHERSDRFVAAATDLMREQGTTDFTVQDVVERSGMSIRTFYKYFASKEDLLLAVSETVVAREAVPRLEELVAKHKAPLRRLRAFIEGLVGLSTGTTKPVARTLASYQNRLAESRPDDLELAMKPQFDLLTELVRDAAAVQPLRRGLTPPAAARLTHYLVRTAVHSRLFGAAGAADLPAQTIWQYCAAGMGFDTENAKKTVPRSRRPSTKTD